MAKTHQYTPTKPKDPHVLTAQVLRSERVSPNVVRVTVGGEGLELFTPQGYDQWFRMFLPREGQETMKLPTRTSALWYAQYLATAKDARPWVRNYTVRAFRETAAGRELDIDFIIHGESAGPASDWATKAAPGDEVGILDQGLGFEPARTPDWTLIVTDETGLPAAAGIVAKLPPDARAEVYIEIPHADDAQELGAPAGVSVHWLVREDAHATPGQLALSTVVAAELPEGAPYCYVVGESSLATGLRRHLVNERGVAKTDVSFVGYWREGVAASS